MYKGVFDFAVVEIAANQPLHVEAGPPSGTKTLHRLLSIKFWDDPDYNN